MPTLFLMRTVLILFLNFLICACTVGGSGAAGSASEGTSTSVSISGSIVGSVVPDVGADSSVVANAKVKVESHPEITATTDSQGHYTINNIDPGEYTLYISSALLASQSVDIKSTSSYGVKIENVVVTSQSNTAATQNNTTVADKTMKQTGGIAGTIEFYQNPNNTGGFNVQFIDSTLTASTALVYCGFMGDKCVAAFNRSSGTSSLACARRQPSL